MERKPSPPMCPFCNGIQIIKAGWVWRQIIRGETPMQHRQQYQCKECGRKFVPK